jgi:hypothetical protein
MMPGASPSGAIVGGLAVVRRVRVAAGFFAAGVFGAAPGVDAFEAEALAAGALAAAALEAAVFDAGAFAGVSPTVGFDAAGFDAAAPVPADARGARRVVPACAGAASVVSPSVGRSPSDGGSAVLISLLPRP